MKTFVNIDEALGGPGPFVAKTKTNIVALFDARIRKLAEEAAIHDVCCWLNDADMYDARFEYHLCLLHDRLNTCLVEIDMRPGLHEEEDLDALLVAEKLIPEISRCREGYRVTDNWDRFAMHAKRDRWKVSGK